MKKFLSTLTIALAALITGTACEGRHDYILGAGGSLVVEVSKNVVLPDGEDSSTIKVLYNGEDVSQDAVLFDAFSNEPTNVPEMVFTSTQEEVFSFWAAYKDSSTIGNPTTITATNKGANDGPALEVIVEPSIIKADGVDKATISVLYNGVDVTNDVIYYVNNNPTDKIVDNTYSTNVEGEFTFWVSYMSESTKDYPSVIRAYNFDIPARAADTNPEKTSFKHRSMLIQFTGTACPNCPGMIKELRAVMAEPEYAAKITHAAIHTYNSGDPCTPIDPLPGLWEPAFNITSYPALRVDAYTGVGPSASQIKGVIDRMHENPAKAGIAANVAINGDRIVIRATVKAAESASFRIGAWLLEDGIEAEQDNKGTPGNYDIHDNCVRIADSRYSSLNFLGHNLGALAAGAYADHVFVLDASKTDNTKKIYDINNCHILIFVSTMDEYNTLYVTNSIDIPLQNGTVSYDYAE